MWSRRTTKSTVLPGAFRERGASTLSDLHCISDIIRLQQCLHQCSHFPGCSFGIDKMESMCRRLFVCFIRICQCVPRLKSISAEGGERKGGSAGVSS